jgi:predicted phosphodiesterase
MRVPPKPIMSSRTLILSDLHLGRPRLAALSAESLRPLWQGCSRLIINGDVAEVHHPTHWSVAARQVLRLHDLCEADDVELTLLSGNHDPYLTDIRHLELVGGSIFITHGDVLHPAVAPWSPRAGIMRDAHERAIAAIPVDERDHLDSRLKVSQFASHVEWSDMAHEAAKSSVPQMLLRPWCVPQVLLYWWRFPRLAAGFLHDHAPHARIGVFGHTHRAGIWSIDDRIIINTGAYGFPGRPWAVMIDDDREARVLKIECDDSTYRFADAPIRVLALPNADVNAPQPLAA